MIENILPESIHSSTNKLAIIVACSLNSKLKLYKDIEAKERQSNLSDNDKTRFYVFLKKPLILDLISSEDAQQLIAAVENGNISLKEAYQLTSNILVEAGKK